jgi:predicted N-acyltransferase
MTTSYRLYDTIDDVPLADWKETYQDGLHGFMEPKFLRAVEKGFADQARFFHVLIDDEDGKPAACASLCLLSIDLLLLAGPRLRRAIGWTRKLVPNLTKLKVLLCGLPLSAGQSSLAFAPGADRERAVRVLDSVMQQVARRQGARLMALKEFGEEDRAHMDVLLQLGHYRADSLPSYRLPRTYASLDAYCGALKARYRTNIKSAMQKFQRSGCRLVHLTDPDEILRVYTPEVHRLYEEVVDKAEVKLEIIPHQFFQELVKQLPGQGVLTVTYRDEHIVAFNWSMLAGQEYHGLFCGIDYAQNAECDLYFNGIYQAMDLAFRSGSQHITMGQTADMFKTRLGCAGHARYLYGRGTGAIVSWLLRKCASALFPPRTPLPAHDVFKETVQGRKEAATVK